MQDWDLVIRTQRSHDYVLKLVLLRDSVYHRQLSARRHALHLAIGRATQQRSKGRLNEVSGTLAYHYSLTEQADLGFPFTALAGGQCLRVFSLAEANRYFASALALYKADPTCEDGDQFAKLLADYALTARLSLEVKTLTGLADRVRPILERFGDSSAHAHFLHHYISCLVWNGRYRDALEVSRALLAMAERLDEDDVLACALVAEMSVSCYCGTLKNDEFEARRRKVEALLVEMKDAYLQNLFMAHLGWNEVGRGRMLGAHAAADRLIEAGQAMNDPLALGYGMAMKG